MMKSRDGKGKNHEQIEINDNDDMEEIIKRKKNMYLVYNKQDWIHGYPSRVRVGRGNIRAH